nr:glycosyltransferase [uncultured Carboxylicivirga sp.]
MKISVILSFYNKIDWLKLVLAGYCRQSFKEFEIVIADDGSRDEVVNEIERMKDDYPFNITHVWHLDNGWQKNVILNKPILACNYDYIIFNDGDCIPHRHFVKEHYVNRQPDTALAGRRVYLPKTLTEELTPKMVLRGYLERKGLFRTLLSKEKHVENGFYLSNSYLKNLITKKDRSILGSNFSMPKKQLLEINGFDERYDLPAIGEDNDLEVRWRNYGMKVRSVKHIAIQYHLNHKILPRNPKHMQILKDHQMNNISWTSHGIVKGKED